VHAPLLYGYCQGERSSRVIEKRCVRDVAYRVITGRLHPDHATIARFRARHGAACHLCWGRLLPLCRPPENGGRFASARHAQAWRSDASPRCPCRPRPSAGGCPDRWGE